MLWKTSNGTSHLSEDSHITVHSQAVIRLHEGHVIWRINEEYYMFSMNADYEKFSINCHVRTIFTRRKISQTQRPFQHELKIVLSEVYTSAIENIIKSSII